MPIFKRVDSKTFHKFLIVIVILSLGMGIGSKLFGNNTSKLLQTEKNTPKSFMSEVYDKIKENYWDNISDDQLKDLFKQATQQNGGEVNKETAAKIAQTILASLNPAGRSGLYTEKQEVALKNTVENINPEKDLYKDLGINKEASKGAIEQAFQDKVKKEPEKAKELSYAKNVLTQKDTKQRYDTNKVEPTIFTRIISSTLYLQFKKFSPTSYDEFIKVFESFKNDNSLTSLIFDLRGNIGGAIDITPYFLGHFIGKNQYAFDFYHKGEYEPFKTPTDKLPSISKYKQVVILVDNNTQSSAEMMTASLKKYHIGVVLGTPTKGWGTVERVFTLDNQFDKGNKYSLFLVHSITLRDDNQPIEGRGVDPDINTQADDWAKQLFSYFRNQDLIQAVKRVY